MSRVKKPFKYTGILFAMKRGPVWTETFPNLLGYPSSPIPSNSVPSLSPQNISSFQIPSPDGDGGKDILLEQIILKEMEEFIRTDKCFQKINWHSYIQKGTRDRGRC